MWSRQRAAGKRKCFTSSKTNKSAAHLSGGADAATNEAVAREMSANDIANTDLETIVIAIRDKAQQLA